MKNVTVSLDDQTYRDARMIAAERGTSLSALVRQFLIGLAKGGDETEQLKRAERVLREQIADFRAADRLPRDEVDRLGHRPDHQPGDRRRHGRER